MVNACLGAGMPHVIAVSKRHEVKDQAAVVFTKQFYKNFFQGKSVAQSFELAKLNVRFDVNDDEADKFRLHGEGDHNRTFTDMTECDIRGGVFTDETRRWVGACYPHD
jgi:hypothetical protein